MTPTTGERGSGPTGSPGAAMSAAEGSLEQRIAAGLGAHRAGDLSGAAAHYEAAQASAPDHPTVLHLLGLLRRDQGDLPAARALLAASVAAGGGAPAAFALGDVWARLGQRTEAAAALRRATELDPGMADAWLNLGVHEAALGAHASAASALGAAARLRPQDPRPWFNLGNLRDSEGVAPAARAAWSEALSRDPTHLAARLHLGRSLVTHRPADAVAHLEQVVARDPRQAAAWASLGHAHLRLAAPGAAASAFTEALRLQPAQPALAVARVEALRLAGDLDGAWRALDALEPGPAARALRLDLQRRRVDEAGLPALEIAVAADTSAALGAQRRPAETPWLAAIRGARPAAQVGVARAWALASGPREAPAPPPWRPPAPDRPLRAGFLTGDLGDHPVSWLTTGVLAALDPARIQAVGLDTAGRPGPVADRARAAFAELLDLSPLGDAAAADAIRGARLDVLVDLSGPTTSGRPGIAAHRPAPVQLEWLGFPGPTGAPWVDGILADAVVLPRPEAAALGVTVWHLPHTYQPTDVDQPVGAAGRRRDHGLPPEALVLAGLHQPAKLSAATLDAWAEVLGALPTAVLWAWARSPAAGRGIARALTRRGVSPSQLVLAPTVDRPAHLARLVHADLALDCWPYGGHTATSDALFMGVPVIGCVGDTFAGRVSASVLGAAGLAELAVSPGAWAATVVALGRDASRRGALRRRVGRTRAAPLFDTAGFADALAGLLRRAVGAGPRRDIPVAIPRRPGAR